MPQRGGLSEDLIARAQEEIRARLAALEPLVFEKDGLERALEALEGSAGPRSTRSVALDRRPPKVVAGHVGAQGAGERRGSGSVWRASAGAYRARPRHPRTHRFGRPRAMGISSSQAANLARRLEERGELRRTNQGLSRSQGSRELQLPHVLDIDTSIPSSSPKPPP